MMWATFGFTADEDLCLLSQDGLLYLIDPRTGKPRDVHPYQLGLEFTKDNIVQGKLDGSSLVFRTASNEFYWIQKIEAHPVAQKLDFVRALNGREKISDFLLIPKSVSGSGDNELLIADPEQGFHLVKEDKNNVVYVKDLNVLATDTRKEYEPFGKILHMALNAKKEMLAFYVETEKGSRIIVLKSDLKKEFNRQELKVSDASQLAWCGNDCAVLSFQDRIMLVGPNQWEVIDLKAQTEGIHIYNELDCLRVCTSEKTYMLERVQDCLYKTFKIASIHPSAKLLNAIKSVDN